MWKVAGILWMLIFTVADIAHGAPQWAFRIHFTDKTGSPALANPSVFLSTRSLQRRAVQGIVIAETDRPVSPVYLADVLSATNSKLHVSSRWFNQCVVLLSDSSKILQLAGKPYVTSIEYLGYFGTALHRELPFSHGPAPLSPLPAARGTAGAAYYGNTWNQTHMLNGDFVHEKGFRGQGQLIAVLDYGFNGVDTHPGFDSLRQQGRLLDAWNFVNASADIYSPNWDHGTACLATMAGVLPGTYVGSAPDAQYALYLTDDNRYDDAQYELDNFVAGLERADSLGADIITSSLGYSYFVHPSNTTFTKAELDGHTTIVARAENLAVTKGIFVVASAGNEGGNSWNFILTPGDADSALTVGAVDANRTIAGFSSPGPNSSGRIKPDVVAQGSPAAVFSSTGLAYNSGTSFSTPQIAGWAACLHQRLPNAPPYQLRRYITDYADRVGVPTTKEGYGIPDFKSVFLQLGIGNVLASSSEGLLIAPNPFMDALSITFTKVQSGSLKGTLLDGAGRVVAERQFNSAAGKFKFEWPLPSSLPSGNYILQLNSGGKVYTRKITKE